MKRVVLLNGSPKKRKAVSEKLLEILKEYIGEVCQTEEIYLYETELDESLYEKIYTADRVVMAQPLYVDCLPARVVEFMEEALKFEKSEDMKKPNLYFILNCGFLEDSQNDTAIRIINKFCRRAGFEFCGGFAIGSGAVILDSHKSAVLTEMLQVMGRRVCFEDECLYPEIFRINVDVNKFLFKAKSDKIWVEAAKKKGLKKKDLKKKYY